MSERPPAEWLAAARADLRAATLISDAEAGNRELRWQAAFHCQQAAEKAIKAVLLDRNGSFPYIHNITQLLSLLPATSVPPSVGAASLLTDYYTAGRYPTGLDIDVPLLNEAAQIAADVVSWAERQLA